ncbi:MAG: aldehyde dehydrogenase family protein [Clostridia bacterium]|nr:aldehyde dehydrogenase family protein [Clostridia bacterium]
METIKELVEKARAAQKEFEGFATQELVDKIATEFAKAIYDNAEPFAKMAVEESRMGRYEDKVKKNRGKAKIIANSLKGKISVGVISRNEETGITEVARPMGVIAAITPCTNPIVTPMCNAMFAIKGRNAIIIAPHPRSKKCTRVIVDMFHEILRKNGAPEDLIQFVEEPSTDLSAELMASCDAVVATGGMAMVKAAYSSGKPAYGVGAGNVQCIIDRDVDFDEVVPKIIEGRAFDNGIICSGEQTIIVHEDDYDKVIKTFEKNGAYYIEDKDTVAKLRNTLFVNGAMNKFCVGQDALKIAEMAGIEVPAGTKVILVKPETCGKGDLFSEEKMCPVISTYKWKTWDEALAIAQANLDVKGRGHSTSIHSNNKEHIEEAANKLTVCRVLVNQVCSTSNGGSFFNGLTPTTTLGCGSWGNNSISENFSYKHLINITRIGYPIKNAKVPTDEEVF